MVVTSECRVFGEGATFWFELRKAGSEGLTVEEPEQTLQPVATEEAEFTPEELSYLRPIVERLKDIPMYKVSAIRKVLQEVDTDRSDAIRAWAENVEVALSMVNRERYTDLVNQITHGSE